MKIINIFIVNMSIVCLSVMAIDVYVENYYGAIAFQVNKGQTQWIPQNAGPQKLGSINQINSLVIGTRVWSYDLLDLLKRIKEESKKAENNGKDVYLIVKSSGYLDKWNIDPVWRVQVTGFSMKSEAEQEQKRIAEEQKKILEKQIEEKSFERKLQRGTISAQK